MTRIVSGGGFNSRVVKQAKSSKVEPKPKAISVEAAARIGVQVQAKTPQLETGPGYRTKPVPPSGIPGTYNAATQGPGSQRAVYRSGSQSQYGPTTPGSTHSAPDVPATEPGKDQLRDFGPERRR
jgi:hypothetical protein